jgi:hypothetical protein
MKDHLTIRVNAMNLKEACRPARDIPKMGMSTIDNDAASADLFWSELRYRIKRATSMTPVEASKMMGRFLSDNRDRWPDDKATTSADLYAVYERALEIREAPTADASARWEREYDSREPRDQAVRDLQEDLYYSARVGWAASEYNLQNAGMIEMLHGHHAGVMLPSYADWVRWTLTNRGRRASDAQLERIMLRDPPPEIAEWDAENEANDVATITNDCGGCDIDDWALAIHRRISVELDKRAERIHQKITRRAKQKDDR